MNNTTKRIAAGKWRPAQGMTLLTQTIDGTTVYDEVPDRSVASRAVGGWSPVEGNPEDLMKPAAKQSAPKPAQPKPTTEDGA